MIPLGTNLVNRKYFRAAAGGLVLIVGLAYLLLGLVDSASQAAAALLLGVAIPTGLLYTVPSLAALKYFPSSITAINGGMQGVQGLGCALVTYVVHYCSNHDNAKLVLGHSRGWIASSITTVIPFDPNSFEI